MMKGLEANPTLNKIYLTSQEDNTISVIDRTTNKMSVIPASGSLDKIEINPQNNKLYASFREANRILVVDSNSDTFVTTFIADQNTRSFSNSGDWTIAVDPKSDILYAVRGSDSISIINGSMGFVSKIAVGKGANDVAVNPTTGIVYTANTDSDSVTAIDVSTARLIMSYSWKQIDGHKVDLSDNKDPTPTFTAPSVKNDDTLRFQLTVIDNHNRKDLFTTDVIVMGN